MEFSCKDTSERSMEERSSVFCTNLIRHDTNNLLEDQVPHDNAVLHMGEERSSYKSQNIHAHSIVDPSLKYLNDFEVLARKSNKDQSLSSVPNICDSFEKNTKQDEENVNEELVPFTFVAVSEIKEPNNEHEYDMSFDSVLKDPLGKYSVTILDVNEERSVRKEFTFKSELQVKKELKDKDDVPESMTGDVIISGELTHSSHMVSSTKCNPIQSCDQECRMDRNPNVPLNATVCSEFYASEINHGLEIKFESICEISEIDVDEKKVFETNLYLNNIVGDNSGTAELKPKCELLNSGDQYFASVDYQQDVKEDDCVASTSKVSIPCASEMGNITAAMYEAQASSSIQTLFSEERRKIMAKMTEHESSSHDDESLISKKHINLRPLVQREPLHLPSHRPLKCEICKESFSGKEHLNEHKRSHIGDRLLECEICKKAFCHKGRLNAHRRTHTGIKPFQCEICKKSYYTKEHLKVHRRTHTGVRPFECGICKKSYSQKGHLNVHMQTHFGEGRFECEICKKSYAVKASLKQHMIIHSVGRPFECEMCKKAFTSNANLTVHMRSHTGIKPFECEICEKSYYTKGHLNDHRRTHTDVKPFQCEICKKSYSQKGHLKVHMRIHTGVRPFECEICKKLFTLKANLAVHIRTHTGERPFECKLCKKSFSHRGNLKDHMRMHTLDKPFECGICHKYIKYRQNLTKHIRSHRAEKSFT